ncbi:MAG: MFS transporter [Halobaculum sp.]
MSETGASSAAADSGETATTTDSNTSIWQNRSFRRFFTGLFLTNVGDSLYGVAILWLVFDLSGSTVLTGLASSLLLLPYLLQFVAGPVVDRLSIRSVMVATQVTQGVVVLALPLAAATGNLSVPLVIGVIPVLSLVGLLFSPVRAAVVPQILPQDQLSDGNSALATVSLGLDMLFDAVGGVFVAMFGATTLFLADSVTFALAAVLFAGVAIPSEPVAESTEDTGDETDDGEDADLRELLTAYTDDLREGVELVRGTLFVPLVVTSAVFNLAVGVTLGILPAFAAGIDGPAVYGFLLAALGVGRLLGSISAPYLDGLPYGPLRAVTALASACLWLGAVLVPSVPATVALFGLAWVSAGSDDVLTSTINQRVFPPDVLGRVSSIKGTASTATLPLGSLVGGFVAELLGVSTTMALAAGGFGFVGCVLALHPRLRGLPAVREVDSSDFGVTARDDTTLSDGDRDQ